MKDPDLNPYAAIALAMALCGVTLLAFDIDWRSWASCFAAAIVALIAWVRS